MSDVIAAQLGRPTRTESQVVATCHLGLPVVIEVRPLLDDGTPFPTRYWLTCPLAVIRLSRLESSGVIKQLEDRRRHDSAFDTALRQAHERYAAERDALVDAEAEHRPAGGVGGARAGIKCLHAHYADHAAGHENPVGGEMAGVIEPLNCELPCVLGGVRNPDWREPPIER